MLSWYKESKVEEKLHAIVKRYPGNGIRIWILDKPKEIFVSFGDWADDIGRILKEIRLAIGSTYKVDHDFEMARPPDTRKWKKVAYTVKTSAQQVPVDTRAYENSMNYLFKELIAYRASRQAELANYKFDPTGLQSVLQKYNYPGLPKLMNAIQSKNESIIIQMVMEIYNWKNQLEKEKKITWQQGQEVWEVTRQLRNLADQIEAQSESYQPYTEQEAMGDMQSIIQSTKQNMQTIAGVVASAIERIQGWNGTQVTVLAHPASKDDYLDPSQSASIEFGPLQDMSPSFTFFQLEGKIEIDDVLEGGDTDFFTDNAVQADYFNLVKELKNPGASSKGGKFVTLYTARPIKDRQMYLDAQQIPSNLFMTTNFASAEGIARDLAGSETLRDVWRVIIDTRYLVETLNMPGEKQYQVIGNGMVPVRSMTLISPGE